MHVLISVSPLSACVVYLSINSPTCIHVRYPSITSVHACIPVLCESAHLCICPPPSLSLWFPCSAEPGLSRAPGTLGTVTRGPCLKVVMWPWPGERLPGNQPWVTSRPNPLPRSICPPVSSTLAYKLDLPLTRGRASCPPTPSRARRPCPRHPRHERLPPRQVPGWQRQSLTSS